MKYRLIPFFLLILGILTGCGTDNSSERKYYSPDNTRGMKIAVLTGSVQELFAKEFAPEAELVQFKVETDLAYNVNNGKVDGALVSSVGWKVMGEDFPNVCCLTDTLQKQPCASIFPKGHRDLVNAYNAFLESYLQSGEYEKSVREWSQRNLTRTMPVVDTLSLKNGVLKIGTSCDIPPYSMIVNNKVAGAEAELAALFAYSLGMKPEFTVLEFSSLLAAVSLGKCDMAFDIVSVTEERAEKVDFGLPDTYESSAFIVNKKYVPDDVLAALGDQPGGNEQETLWSRTKSSFVKNILLENRYELLLEGLWNTIVIVIFSAILGTLLGIFLCFMNMNRRKWVRGISTVYIEFMRCMPQMVFLMIMYYIVFGESSLDGIVVSIISFALCFGAYTSVIFQSAVQCIDRGQTEAALSLGFTRMKSFFFIILPQAVQNALPVYKGEFIGLVKATSIVGYIAVFDLTKASDLIRSRTFEAFFPLIIITVLYFLIIWVLSIALKYAEVMTRPKRRKY